MKIYEIHTMTGRPKETKVLASLYMKDGKVVGSGDKRILDELESTGATGAGGEVFTPKDGEKFLDALRWQYNGSYTFVRIREE